MDRHYGNITSDLADSSSASPSFTQAPGLPATQTMSTNTLAIVLLVMLALGLLAFMA